MTSASPPAEPLRRTSAGHADAAGAVDRYGTALAATALSAAVAGALVGGAAAKIGVGIVLAMLAVGAAQLLRRAWRARTTAGISVLVLTVPASGLLIAATATDVSRADRVAHAADLAVATLFVAAAVLVFAGARRAVLAGRRRALTPWASLVTADHADDASFVAGRRLAIAGGLLVVGGLLLVVIAPRGFAGLGVSGSGMALLAALSAAGLVVAPALAAVAVVGRRDRAERERALQRQAVAAHLHDSVLQTFALVQRRLDDPDEVRRLIRRQERELRDWLAGRDALRPDTLAGALQQVVDEVEVEFHVSIELELLGDRRVGRAEGNLVDATREALRNAARHGDGAPIHVLAATDGPATEVYVRDEGPGFVLDAVPAERRGIRDAIVGRMIAVGGSAVIDAVPDVGTEVVLRLPLRSEDAS